MTDVLIIGGGPAGATAAVYVARAGFAATLIYKDFGALEKAERVDNFYGFSKISGKSLVEKGLRQARKSGAKTIRGEVLGLRSLDDGNFSVETDAAVFKARTVLLATGANRATPKIRGLADFEGRGVSHCAICDGFFFREKNVAVLGNGAYALHEIADLLPLAASVTLLTNGREMLFTPPEQVAVRTKKIREIVGAEEKSTFGMVSKTLTGIVFENGDTLPLSGLFIAEGTAGGTELARKIGASIDASGGVAASGSFGSGLITVDHEQRTSVNGLWAAGDCTAGMKQIVKAAHDGAEAALSIVKYLRGDF